MFHVRTALHYYMLVWVFFVMLFIADRVTKQIALALIPSQGVFASGDSLGFIVERNQGIAFSLPLPSFYIALVVFFVVIYLVWLMRTSIRRGERLVAWGAGFMIVGALANAFDRIRFGHVIDFIRLTRWPTFNLADVYISIGVSILVGFYLFKSTSYARSTAHGNDRRN